MGLELLNSKKCKTISLWNAVMTRLVVDCSLKHVFLITGFKYNIFDLTATWEFALSLL